VSVEIVTDTNIVTLGKHRYKLPDDGSVKLKHVGAFIVNFNILKQINCALVGLIKDWIISKCTVKL
jgi:hypothetical protein